MTDDKKCEIKDRAFCQYPCAHCDEEPMVQVIRDLIERVAKLERQSWM